MALNRRDLTLGVAASALFAGDAAAQSRSRGPVVGRYPAPVYAPEIPGTAWFAPDVPLYPQPNVSDDRLVADAQALSQQLEDYIRAWLDDRADAVLPERVLPPGWHRRDYPSWRLIREGDVRPETQWPTRPAHQIQREALHGGFPDPNCTYMAAPLYAPFGSTLLIEGEFPRARFFDVQVTPGFDPRSYRYDGYGGVGEVPIVDADIEPLPGHTNPFRPGAARLGAQRGYRLAWLMAIGDPVAANPAFRPPHFRGRGNNRVGGGIMYQGPYADRRGQGHKRGRWDHGSIWVRYYRPDLAAGPWGGVALPKLTLQLADGQRFWLQADFSGLVARVNRLVRPRPTSPALQPLNGPDAGWTKQAGIVRAIFSGFAFYTNWASKQWIRDFDKGSVARGSDLAPPNNYEQSATSCTYIDYLVRSMECPEGQVVVLTGRLPTVPRTQNGAAVMETAQARYWSLTGYVQPEGFDMLAAVTNPNYPGGLAAHCVMDEDIVLQPQRRFVIALSRPEDRPDNATAAAGVTWADWGLAGTVSWTLRWMSVGPEWTAPMAPTPERIGRRGEWAEQAFDPNTFPNRHDGALGEYLPKVHLMSRVAFEALGPSVAFERVPTWRG